MRIVLEKNETRNARIVSLAAKANSLLVCVLFSSFFFAAAAADLFCEDNKVSFLIVFQWVIWMLCTVVPFVEDPRRSIFKHNSHQALANCVRRERGTNAWKEKT